MTDLDLQEKLIVRIKDIMEKYSLKRTDDEEWYDFNIYANELPVKTDYNDDEEQNYIVVIIGDEDERQDGSWDVEMQIIFGYADRDENRQAHVVLYTLMNNIFMDLKKHESIDERYELLTKSHKRYADQHREGFYESALIMTWTIPPFLQEDLRELV